MGAVHFRDGSLRAPHDRAGDFGTYATVARPVAGCGWTRNAEHVLGPGWAHLLARLDRRLAADGVPLSALPRLAWVGAGALGLSCPPFATMRTGRRALAVSRLSTRCCEICLRRPADRVDTPASLARLCAWHATRLDGLTLSNPAAALSELRREAWDVVHCGDGALRALLLGARLSPDGVREACATYAQLLAEGAESDVDLWVSSRLFLHALTHLHDGLWRQVAPAAFAPLLVTDDTEIRTAALLAMTRAAGGDRPSDEHRAPPGVPEGTGIDTATTVPHNARHAAGAARVSAEAAATWARAWAITTLDGHLYLVGDDPQGGWWCQAAPNAGLDRLVRFVTGGRADDGDPTSPVRPLGTRAWAIVPPAPWPPLIGEPLVLAAPSAYDTADPARLPGGAHVSDLVAEVVALGDARVEAGREAAVDPTTAPVARVAGPTP